MKILQVHNTYQFSGGEDVVCEAEKNLLQDYGHSVIRYERKNEDIKSFNSLEKASLFFETAWSNESYKKIKIILDREKPDICHVHNYLPLVSPSVFYACKERHVPAIQTLHNYRMLCSNAYFLRDGKVCEECLGGSLYRSIKYGCYRDSMVQTFALARMVEKHKKMGTWEQIVDGYICLTNFSKNKFKVGGLAENKLFLKPNFLFHDPRRIVKADDYFLFLGRLETLKGVRLILNSSKFIKNIELKLAGDGPLKSEVTNPIYSNVEYLGFLNKKEVYTYLNRAIALIFPPLLFENMPLSILESFGCGKPVIASNHGAMAEMIVDGKTGLLFTPGNTKDLAKKIKWAYEHKEEMRQMGLNARREYEEKYTSEKNYEILMDIYNQVIKKSKRNK